MDDKEKIRNLIDTVVGFHGTACQELYDQLHDAGLTHEEMEAAELNLQHFYRHDYEALNHFGKQMQLVCNIVFDEVREELESEGDIHAEIDIADIVKRNTELPIAITPYLQMLLKDMLEERAIAEDLSIDWDSYDADAIWSEGNELRHNPRLEM